MLSIVQPRSTAKAMSVLTARFLLVCVFVASCRMEIFVKTYLRTHLPTCNVIPARSLICCSIIATLKWRSQTFFFNLTPPSCTVHSFRRNYDLSSGSKWIWLKRVCTCKCTIVIIQFKTSLTDPSGLPPRTVPVMYLSVFPSVTLLADWEDDLFWKSSGYLSSYEELGKLLVHSVIDYFVLHRKNN
jgi:hypothetical protein